MPELFWVKWFPTHWYSDPGLARCDAATRGIWADIVNTLYLSGTASLTGSDEELCRLLRCRLDQLQTAIAELRKFGVCAIEMQNGCTTFTCRRMLREFSIKQIRKNAANSRWCKRDANTHARSDSDSDSDSDSCTREGVTGGEFEQSPGRTITQELMYRLSCAFLRPKDSVWSYAEETAAAEVARRPGCLTELDSLLKFRKTTEYFPQSISALLQKWGEVLDRSRNGAGPTSGLPLWRQVQAVTDLISKHPANRESTFHNPKCTPDQKNELTELRTKLDELNNRMAGGSK